MIVQELIDENTVHTYSDKGFYIYGGFPEGNYIEAIDPISKNRKYKETNIPIIINTETNEEDEENNNHLLIEKHRQMAELANQQENE